MSAIQALVHSRQQQTVQEMVTDVGRFVRLRFILNFWRVASSHKIPQLITVNRRGKPNKHMNRRCATN